MCHTAISAKIVLLLASFIVRRHILLSLNTLLRTVKDGNHKIVIAAMAVAHIDPVDLYEYLL